MKKVLVLLATALAVAPSALAARPKPVPSLTPAATHRLWLAEVEQARTRRSSLAAADCRPARVVFYAQTDWLRLATKLAQASSPCAEYLVSVPPLAADKTQARSGQASQIRALGTNFHAVDEVSYSGWSAWVSSGAGSWYDAGVLARQRMAAAGFDTSAGDSWAMNELSSAVRTGAGSARRNALDFLHGLAVDGVKGVVFAAGVGQPTSDLTQYKVSLQDWLQDGSFWTEAAGYVSDWAQEVYGDLRDYAVAGSSPQQRRDAMVQYLAHEQILVGTGPAATAPARSLLQQSFVPFGNAAWAWASAYGWTAGPVETMEDFVSGQVYADRSFAAATGAPVDRLGFAWSPNNTQGLSSADFTTQTGAILDRLSAAIRDSGVPSADPGGAACAPSWCGTAIDGAAFTPTWLAFSAWSPTVPVFTTAPINAAADVAAGPVTVQLQTSGIADSAGPSRTVTLSTSSPAGGFAATAAGPWTPSLALTIPTGSSSVSFFYDDSAGGAPTITATLDDGSTATQTETVTVTIGPGASGPPAPPPGSTVLGSPPPSSGPRTAPAKPAPVPHVRHVRTHFAGGHLVVSASVAAGTTTPAGVLVRIRVRRGSRLIALVTRRTASGGVATWRSAHKVRKANYVATAAAVR